jgi:crotonobetainyl-CoA:carnitine CoA-transferase CaiB-like acyl-CoA transferase
MGCESECPLLNRQAALKLKKHSGETTTKPRPLAGIRVVEFVHMVMGPSCGLILADLGADVIKIEPVPDGDNTRLVYCSLKGFLSGPYQERTALDVALA